LQGVAEKNTKDEIAGVPVYNSGEVGVNEVTQWILMFKTGSSDSQVQATCNEYSASCDAEGQPSAGGLGFAALRASREELEDVVKKHADKLEFVEPALPIFIPEGEHPEDERPQDEPTNRSALLDDSFANSDLSLLASPRRLSSPTDRWGLDRIDDRRGFDGTYVASGDGKGVHVYVFDTGIRTTHEDFEGRAILAYDTTIGMHRPCAPGHPSCGMDRNGHGTHCAGTVGGAKSGVAKAVTLHAVKVLGDDGFGSTTGVVNAINWVMQKAPKPAVISMSLSGLGRSQVHKTAIDRAAAAKVVSVVAGGNSRADACQYSPAFVPSAITVGATDRRDARASFSNFGTCTDIFAPGVNILSAWNTSDTNYRSISGTSMACPHVAGATALLLQKNKELGAADLSNALRSASTKNAISKVGAGSPNMLLYMSPGDGSDTTPGPTPRPSRRRRRRSTRRRRRSSRRRSSTRRRRRSSRRRSQRSAPGLSAE